MTSLAAIELKDWIPVLGWFVTFSFGVLSGGFIVPRLTAKRKIIDWAVLSENELIPKELSKLLGVSVVMQVGQETPNSLSTIHLRIRGGGNDVIENIAVRAKFNPGSKVLNVRCIKDLGEYDQHVKWLLDQNSFRLEMDFLNPDTVIDLEILLSEYVLSSVIVDGAAPQVRVRRKEALQLDLTRSILGSVVSGFGLDLFGLRYDPKASSLREIAQELRELRQHIKQ